MLHQLTNNDCKNIVFPYYPKSYIPSKYLAPIANGTNTLNNKWYKVEVNQIEYIISEKTDYYCTRGKRENSDFQKGLVNTKDDQQKAERIGNLGEIAFAKSLQPYFNDKLFIDFSRNDDGKPKMFDFLINDKKVEIKTAVSATTNRTCVRVTTGPNKDIGRIPLTADIYVSAFLLKEEQENKRAKIVLVGWQTKDFVEKKLDDEYGKGKRFFNRHLYFEKMLPLFDIVDYLKK